MNPNLMEQIASDEILEDAFAWLCKRRENYSHNDEVWRVRAQWTDVKLELQENLLEGKYAFSPLKRIHRAEDSIEIWSAID